MDTLILDATRVRGGRSTGLLEVSGEPVAARLARQASQVGAGSVIVLAPAGDADALAAAIPSAEVVAVEDLRSALTALRDALPASGTSLLCHADVVVHDALLRGVVERPSPANVALTGTAIDDARRQQPPIRSIRGRVVAAGSAWFEVEAPNRVALGVLALNDAGSASLRAGIAELLDLLGTRGAATGDEPSPDPTAPGEVEQLLPLATVAVVHRAEVPVLASEVRRFPWARPTDASQAAASAATLAEIDEDDLVLDAAVKAEDGFFTTYLVSPYSRHIARWCARRGLTPNQVTSFSFLLGVLAAAAFAVGSRTAAVAGAILLQAAFTFDCVDGQLARYTRRFSAFGAWLDSVFDRGKEYVVYAGLAVGASRTGDAVWLLASAALALQTLRHHVDFAYAAQQGDDVGAAVRTPLHRLTRVRRSHWEAEPTAGAGGGPVRRAIAAGLRAARRLEGIRGARWIKRIVVLPIGERFALISLAAVLWGPRGTFVALLGWGGLAAAYTTGGRVVRSWV